MTCEMPKYIMIRLPAVEIRLEIEPCTLESIVSFSPIRRDLIYSFSMLASSVSSFALPLIVSTARRPSMICEFRTEDCCICSSLIFLYGCLKIKTSRMLQTVRQRMMPNSERFILNRIMPVTIVIATSMMSVSAMLIVNASLNLVMMSPVFRDAKNFIGSL